MIYFVKHIQSGLIKIGYTDNFRHRRAQLTTKYGQLELLGIMEGERSTEQFLHNFYQPHNVRGVLPGVEWFRQNDDLLEYIRLNCVSVRQKRTVVISDNLKMFLDGLIERNPQPTTYAELIEAAVRKVNPNYDKYLVAKRQADTILDEALGEVRGDS